MKVRLKKEITGKRTNYFWGPVSDIAGKTLTVFDKAVDGSGYLCMIPGKGLADIDINDVERVVGESW